MEGMSDAPHAAGIVKTLVADLCGICICSICVCGVCGLIYVSQLLYQRVIYLH